MHKLSILDTNEDEFTGPEQDNDILVTESTIDNRKKV